MSFRGYIFYFWSRNFFGNHSDLGLLQCLFEEFLSMAELFIHNIFFKQSATEIHDLLCFCPTTTNLVLNICPILQVLDFHFSEVDDLLYAKKNVIMWKENDSTPVYFLSWCYFMLGYCQEFWYILSGLKYLSIPKMKIMNQACQKPVQICRNDKSYTWFPVDLYELVVDCMWLPVRQVAICAMCFRFPQCAETLSSPLAILRGTEPIMELTQALFYCCTLYSASVFFSIFVYGNLVLTGI